MLFLVGFKQVQRSVNCLSCVLLYKGRAGHDQSIG